MREKSKRSLPHTTLVCLSELQMPNLSIAAAGGWPPHVHFQLSWEEPETHDMPGVVSNTQHASALRTYPDPRIVLGAELYKGEGLFE